MLWFDVMMEVRDGYPAPHAAPAAREQKANEKGLVANVRTAEVTINTTTFAAGTCWTMAAIFFGMDCLWFTGDASLMLGRAMFISLFVAMATTIAAIMDRHAERLVVRRYDRAIDNLPAQNGNAVRTLDRSRG